MSSVKNSMIVEFVSESAARSALPRIRRFLERMAEARDYWLGICMDEGQPAAERLEDLQTRFPDVFARLMLDLPDGRELGLDCAMVFLCGQLESPAADPGWSIRQDGKRVHFCGHVWQVADWEPLMMAMAHLGARGALWKSEEELPCLAILDARKI